MNTKPNDRDILVESIINNGFELSSYEIDVGCDESNLRQCQKYIHHYATWLAQCVESNVTE